MTNVEKTLFEKEHRNFMLAKLADKKICKLEKSLRELSEDHYYADSWEQADQISRKMERIREKINLLNAIKRKLYCGCKVELSELTQFKNICRCAWY